MKTYALFLGFYLIISSALFAQNVGINSDGSTPNGSAMLDVKSTTGGLLIPRMTQTQREAISAPAQGLMVYQTTSPAGFYYYDGSSWAIIGGSAGSESDPVFTASPAQGITNTNISNWTTSFGWGNHATAGYLTSFSETDPVFGAHAANGITGTNITNWNSAYSWGNHAAAGYLSSFTETDPVFLASPAHGITGTNITNWNSAYSWGNHAAAGYLTSATLNETDPTVPDYVKSITSTEKSNWNTAYGWGNHALAGYLTAASLSETDPVFVVSPANGITSGNISTWNGLVSSQWTTATNDIYYNTGSVAIGTTSPGAYKLNVNGSINGTSITINGTPVASSTDTYWSTGGSGKIYYSGGNVGVGVASPAYPLDVTGDVNITGNFRVNGTPLTGTGTVTSVAAGNGMNFTAITGSGSVTLGTPSTLTSATTNTVSSTSHAHAITTQLPSSTTAGVMLQSGAKTAGGFYGGTTAPTNTTRANYDGYLYATRFYGDGSQLTGITATGYTGTLPVTNGGTGTATAPSQGGVIYASSTSAYASTAAGTTGYLLQSNGTSAPGWLSTVPVANGGTGATTAAAARTNLGATTVGSNLFTLTNPSSITFPRFNADNTVSALDAASFRTAIGAGTGGGTVTSVTGTLPLTVANGTTTPAISLGTVGVANGGTGQTTYAVGDLLYASTTSALSKLADVATGNALISGGVSTAPSWGKIGLTTHVTGTLSVTNGGTGSTSATVAGGVVYGSSTSAMASTTAGTTGQVLTSNGSSAPTWTTIGVAPTGSIMIWAGSTAPAGWLLCDGSAASTTTYSALYAVIGTTYGSGSGTFLVPNLKGKIPVGFDASQTEFNTRGETGGEKTHQLTTAEMPNHRHTEQYYNPSSAKVKGDGNGTIYTAPTSSSTNTGYAGGDGAHNNLQPYIVLYYIIKY